MRNGLLRCVIGAALALPATGRILAQCPPEWSDAFNGGSIDGTVYAAAVFDDGRGEALYVGGDFKHAGGVEVYNIARFDGANWEALNFGVRGVVRAITVYDDGAGPALYIGGAGLYVPSEFIFQAASLLKWNGAAWVNPADFPAGIQGEVMALQTYDDGNGESLYIGGSFSLSAIVGSPQGVLASWDGSDFEFVTDSGNAGTSAVSDMTVFDDGSGPALFATGSFSFGSPSLSRVIRWDGMSLQGLASTPLFPCGDVMTASIGGAEALYFWSLPDDLWKWDGTTLTQVMPPSGSGSAIPRSFTEMTSEGNALIAAGQFDFDGLVRQNAVMRWDGSVWSPIADDYCGSAGMLEVLDAGDGPRVYFGGDFNSVDGVTARSLASFDGADWNDVGTPDTGNTIFGGPVYAIAAVDGHGVAVAGDFAGTGALCTGPIALWNGAEWVDISGGEFQHVIESFTDLVWVGSGDQATLFARGDFRQDGVFASLASWNGSRWTLHPVDDEPNADGLFAFDDGDGETVYTDEFDKWNGAAWEAPVGSPGSMLRVLGVVEVRGEPRLMASTMVAGEVRLAVRHNGSWELLPGAFGGVSATFPPASTTIRSVAAIGDELFVGGNFDSTGGAAVTGLARWDGLAWSDVGGGFAGASGAQIFELNVADDGAGPVLFAYGNFTFAGTVEAHMLARWDGSEWSQVGMGLDAQAVPLFASFTDGPRRSLFVAGRIGTDGHGDAYETFARWGAPFFPGDATGDGAVDVDDLNAVLSSWNSAVPTPGLAGDVTRDGVVDVDDLNAVLSAWLKTCG